VASPVMHLANGLEDRAQRCWKRSTSSAVKANRKGETWSTSSLEFATSQSSRTLLGNTTSRRRSRARPGESRTTVCYAAHVKKGAKGGNLVSPLMRKAPFGALRL
jgi:hypothetical protein